MEDRATTLAISSGNPAGANRARRNRKRRGRCGHHSFAVEPLEERRLLTASSIPLAFATAAYTGPIVGPLLPAEITPIAHPLVTNPDTVIDGTTGSDQFVVSIFDTGEGNVIRVTLNGSVVADLDPGVLKSLTINGLGGNDTLTVDSTNGLIVIDDGIFFTGGTGSDTLRLIQQGGTQTSDVYSVGPTVGSGSSVITGALGMQQVWFEGIEPVIDLVPAATLTVNATNGDNAINYTQGSVVANGLVTIDNQESIEFSNKDNLVINALNGSDSVNLRDASAPAGSTPGSNLAWVTVSGSDPTGTDTLILNNVAGIPDSLTLQPTAQGAGVVSSSFVALPPVTFDGIEHLQLVAQSNDTDAFAINGTSGDDAFFYTVGATPDAGTVTGIMNQSGSSFPLVPVTFAGMAPGSLREFNKNNPAGNDTFAYNGSSSRDVVTISQLATDATIADVIGSVNFGTAAARNMAAISVDTAGGNDQVTYNTTATATSATQIALEGGDSDATSDSLTINTLANSATTIDLQTLTISSTGQFPLAIGGFEKVAVNKSGATATLNVQGTANDDNLTYTPTAVDAGNFQLADLAVLFSFAGLTGAFTVAGGTQDADMLTLRGTAGRDTISIDATARTAQVNGLKAVTLDTTLEILTAQGLAGDDTFNVVPAPGVGGGVANLLINIDGGDPQASDALVISGPAGATLAANQFVVLNRSQTAGAGTVRVYTAAVAAPDITYKDIEVVSPKVSGTGFNTNLLVMGPDGNEPNDTLGAATFLGSGPNLQIQHASIFPSSNEFETVPADQDYYRVVANSTGTLDFQVYFRQFDTGLLPGGGALGIEVLDANGAVVAAAGAVTTQIFGASSATAPNSGARVRIPAVAGQSYFLHVFGQVVPTAPVSPVVNGYDATIVNTPAPQPFDIALSRSVAAPLPGNPDTGDLPNDAVNSDSGRSQFDNVTNIALPTIYVRLSDGTLLNDLPGNAMSGNAPIGAISIPFVGPGDSPTPGFRIAVFDGNNTQTPVGFATAVAGFPGLYQYTFTSSLADGLHHISAAVQIVDPNSVSAVTGFSTLSSTSLQLIVDTAAPLAFFGSSLSSTDGLDAASDTGVPTTPVTYTDRITSDTTPTVYGTAEANSVIKLFVRVDSETGPVDIPLGQTVAIPLDGTNAYPGGSWKLTSNLDLNALPDPDNPGSLLPRDGVRHLVITAEDLAGNVSSEQTLDIFVDTQGPQVSGLLVNGQPFDLFAGKGSGGTPTATPVVNSLTVNIEDLPLEDAAFLRDAIAAGSASLPGLITLKGDNNGVIPIQSITITNLSPQVAGDPAKATITINFFKALPDDRYTFIVSDALTDPAGNHLDGENTSADGQPPSFNSGNGIPGGPFVVRFTVDSHPEIAVYAGKGIVTDMNGNGVFDPANPDATNRDLVFQFGEVSDQRFAGKFSPTKLPGYDVFAAYGNINGQYRLLIDLNGNGAVDFDENFAMPANLQINGIAVAGNFDGDASNGDEIAIFTGTQFYILNNARTSATVVNTPLRGFPLAGDFDGDGITDLATYQNDTFSFDFGNDGFGSVQATINFGAPGILERPVAADMDGDGITDIGLWIPHSGTDQGTAEWRWLVSNDPNKTKRVTDSVTTLAHPFSPVPLGSDLGYHFGDPTALPLVGNFDPPSTTNSGTTGTPTSGSGGATASSSVDAATQARSVVAALYQDILGRTPDTAGWNLFAGQIVTGATRASVAHALQTSPEYYGHVVDTLYSTYLHRQADANGRAYWTGRLAAGASQDSVAIGLMTSTEFNQANAGNAAFLEAVYQGILGRASDVNGRSTFLFTLGTGGSRGDVVRALLASQERAARIVDQAYLELFGRHAEQQGVAFWSNKLRAGQLNSSSLTEALVATDEYFAHLPNS